jgi:lactate dehydrogenase-like 2-hydroxyacid dehydrogenase
LQLIVCNGRTSNVVDHEARIERGILLCGTVDSDGGAAARSFDYQVPRGLPEPSEMAWALILGVAKDELLSSSDIVGVFLGFSERSRHTRRADDLAKMKPAAILVNISRGPLFRTAWVRMAEDVAAYLAGSPIRVVTSPADCPPMAAQ